MKIAWIRLKLGLQQFRAEDVFRADLDTQIEEVPHGFKITSKDKNGEAQSVGVPSANVQSWGYAQEKKQAKAAG